MVKYVLSLDGGGIKGLMTLHFLKELDIYLKRRYGKRIYDIFSLYVGTSVGAMIAACLACNKNTDEMTDYADKNIEKTFHRRGLTFPWSNKYLSIGRDEMIAGILPDISMDKVLRPLLIPVYNITHRRSEVFGNTSISLHKAVQATSAAPSYFAAVEINNMYYIDGGMACIDPVMCCYSEAKTRWRDEKIKILSVGTGIFTHGPTKPSRFWGAYQWIVKGRLVDILLGASGELGREQLTKLIGNDYLRINSRLERNIPLDSTDKFDLSYLKLLGVRNFRDFKNDLDRFFDSV
uniref:Patatin-like phospholipase n=1 Tax=Pithovirus LCPAC403 TaxID=2506596 RepID=A0A481ZBD1_9VIRU|nr:MAG: patatin-like phospholipase [Pithovirus LCPAC403]